MAWELPAGEFQTLSPPICFPGPFNEPLPRTQEVTLDALTLMCPTQVPRVPTGMASLAVSLSLQCTLTQRDNGSSHKLARLPPPPPQAVAPVPPSFLAWRGEDVVLCPRLCPNGARDPSFGNARGGRGGLPNQGAVQDSGDPGPVRGGSQSFLLSAEPCRSLQIGTCRRPTGVHARRTVQPTRVCTPHTGSALCVPNVSWKGWDSHQLCSYEHSSRRGF